MKIGANYTPDPRPSYAAVDSDGPNFIEALREQLGLKLQDRRAPVEFLYVDHVEHPEQYHDASMRDSTLGEANLGLGLLLIEKGEKAV